MWMMLMLLSVKAHEFETESVTDWNSLMALLGKNQFNPLNPRFFDHDNELKSWQAEQKRRKS